MGVNLTIPEEFINQYETIMSSAGEKGQEDAKSKFQRYRPVLKGKKLYKDCWVGVLFRDFLESKRISTDGKNIVDEALKEVNLFWKVISTSEYISNKKGLTKNQAEKILKILAGRYNIDLIVMFLEFLVFCEGKPLACFYKLSSSEQDKINQEEVLKKERKERNKRTNKRDPLTPTPPSEDDKVHHKEAKQRAIDTVKNIIEDIEKFLGKGAALIENSQSRNTTKNRPKNYYDPFFRTIIRGRIDDYIERKFTLNRIIGHLKSDSDRGFITIEGEPGTGKTTVLANIANEYINGKKLVPDSYCIWHFNSISIGRNTTYFFLETLFECLSDYFDLSDLKNKYEKQLSDKANFRGDLIPEILETVSDQLKEKGINFKLLVIIDALDEVDRNDSLIFKGNLHNSLGIPAELPERIFFLISTRKLGDEKYHDLLESITYNELEVHHKEEIREYIYSQLQNNNGVIHWIEKHQFDKETFVSLLCEYSKYSFIYLHYVFKDIGRYKPDTIPEGLNEYYGEQIGRMLHKNFDVQMAKKLLAGIYFYEHISMRRLADFCDLNSFEAVEQLFNYWLGLKIVCADGQNIEFFKFFHKSFYDFLESSQYSSCKDIRKISEIESDAYNCHAILINNLCKKVSALFDDEVIDEPINDDVIQEMLNITFNYADKTRSFLQLGELLVKRHYILSLIKHRICSRQEIFYKLERISDDIESNAFDKEKGREKWQDLALRFIENIMNLDNPALDSEYLSQAYPETTTPFQKFLRNNQPIG